MRELYEAGGCVAGTSAGASVVCETMLVTGDSGASPRVDDAVRMAPGFGFLAGAIVDQHFAERGRIGRLIGAVAQNPRTLGIGIDEDTAVVCDDGRSFTVLSSGGLCVHLLNTGDTFDLATRHPACHPAREAEERLAGVR